MQEPEYNNYYISVVDSSGEVTDQYEALYTNDELDEDINEASMCGMKLLYQMVR